jgi:pimeloyl-ACP methyl ester carboxylesterase
VTQGHAYVATLRGDEGFVLPGATHALQLDNPAAMAQALAGFISRNPLPSC